MGKKKVLVSYGVVRIPDMDVAITMCHTNGKAKDIDAVAGWLGSYGGEDSMSDISRGLSESPWA